MLEIVSEVVPTPKLISMYYSITVESLVLLSATSPNPLKFALSHLTIYTRCQ